MSFAARLPQLGDRGTLPRPQHKDKQAGERGEERKHCYALKETGGRLRCSRADLLASVTRSRSRASASAGAMVVLATGLCGLLVCRGLVLLVRTVAGSAAGEIVFAADRKPHHRKNGRRKSCWRPPRYSRGQGPAGGPVEGAHLAVHVCRGSLGPAAKPQRKKTMLSRKFMGRFFGRACRHRSDVSSRYGSPRRDVAGSRWRVSDT